MSSAGRLRYSELVDIPKLQALMESFSEVVGVANAVIEVDGTVIVHAGWQDACTDFHRVNPETCRRCLESDTSLVNSMTEGKALAIYRCHNGLVDTAARIIVNGEHVASVFTGQFLTEAPDLDFFRRQASQFGFDETAYLAAIGRVPILPRARVEALTRLYAQLASMLADKGLDYLGQIKTAANLADLNRALEDKVIARTQALALANEGLAAREALFKQILDTASVAIFLVDGEGRITQANQRMAEMFGCSLDSLLGNEYVALVHPSERESGRQKMLALLSSAVSSVDLERLYWRQDHTEFWGRLTGKRFYDASGQADGLVGVIVDISERKRADHDLRIAATAFESQEGMFITDATQVILRVNRAFSEITGYSAADSIGQTPQLLNSGRHDADFFAAMMESIERSGTWQGEIWNRRKNGEIHPEWLTITAVKDAAGKIVNYVATLIDITARKASEDRIRNLAFYDQLTQLPNRRLMLDQLGLALESSACSGRYGALLLIDLDNFKTLNDTLGHEVGDQLLLGVASRLQACIEGGATLARLGGDEFVVILSGLDEGGLAAAQAESVARKILAQLSQPYLLDLPLSGKLLSKCSHHCTSSIGIALFRNLAVSVDELMKRADTAMYEAKAAGRNTLRFFDPAMQAAIAARAALELDLRKAIIDRQFLLYYQAQVDSSGRVSGCEALLRWPHPERGLVSPLSFIPLAEETGLILPLGQWVLETACDQLAAWATRPETAALTLAVNVSARQFHQPDFVEQVLAALQRSGANAQRLKLELTESLLVANVEDVIAKMTVLKAAGVGFSLDDFGTGYSSLSCLKRLPLDQLKIDQGFVRDILVDPNDAAIARMVVALAESMGLTVIAEGVEIEAQRVLLATLGCHAYQGYLFSRPLQLEAFETLFGQGRGQLPA
ncbi:MAG: EAL domain-containing protein [Rhodocyclaceae bacterium]